MFLESLFNDRTRRVSHNWYIVWNNTRKLEMAHFASTGDRPFVQAVLPGRLSAFVPTVIRPLAQAVLLQYQTPVLWMRPCPTTLGENRQTDRQISRQTARVITILRQPSAGDEVKRKKQRSWNFLFWAVKHGREGVNLQSTAWLTTGLPPTHHNTLSLTRRKTSFKWAVTRGDYCVLRCHRWDKCRISLNIVIKSAELWYAHHTQVQMIV